MAPDEGVVVMAGGCSVRAASLRTEQALPEAPVYDFSFPGRMIEIMFDSWAQLLAANVGGRMYRLCLSGLNRFDNDDKRSLLVVEAVDFRGKEVAFAWTFASMQSQPWASRGCQKSKKPRQPLTRPARRIPACPRRHLRRVLRRPCTISSL